MKKDKLIKLNNMNWYLSEQRGGAQMNEIPEQIVAKLKQEINEVDDVKLKMIATEEGDVTVIYFSSLIEKMTLQTMVTIPLANNLKQIHQMAQYVDPKDVQGVVKN